RWPSEALMEGWFPLRSGEHASLPIAEVAGSRAREDDRTPRAVPADPAAVLSHPVTPSRLAAGHRTAMMRGVDAGCHCTCMPATVKVSLDMLLHGRHPNALHTGWAVRDHGTGSGGGDRAGCCRPRSSLAWATASAPCEAQRL